MANKITSLQKAGKYEMESLVPLDVRDVWKHEALDFTPWLAREESLALLGETLGLVLKGVPQTETKVEWSDRRCDIEAQVVKEDGDEESETLIIENQLEETDFSHLGRVMLYAAQRNAKYVVWVVPEVSQDHRRVIAWLNRITNADVEFYLVKIAVYALGENRAAPIFTLVERPDTEEKVKKSGTPREKRNLQFWQGFYDFTNSEDVREKLLCINSFRSASQYNWYDVAIGTSSCHFALWNSSQRADISIVSKRSDVFGKLSSKLAELKNVAGTDKVTVNSENDHPTIRFEGVAYTMTDEKSRENAYGWMAEKLAALAPLVKKILGVGCGGVV